MLGDPTLFWAKLLKINLGPNLAKILFLGELRRLRACCKAQWGEINRLNLMGGSSIVIASKCPHLL